MDDLISKLSEIRSEYNCFDEDKEPYYRALSKAIRILSSECEYWDSESNFCSLYRPFAIRRGRWEHYEHREPQYDIMGVKTWAEVYKCSNCGFIHTVIEDFGHYSFCPRCGADMRGEKE